MNQSDKRNTSLTPRSVLERKLLMGRGASYRVIADKIAEITGVSISHTAVRAVLTEAETGLPIDRQKVLTQTSVALDQIEREQALERAA